MKSIKCNINITSIRAKVDRSISATINTPELDNEERSAFFDLQNRNLAMILVPLEEDQIEEVVVDKDLEQKSQSQRIRACLFLLWKKDPENMEWDQYYRNKTEKYISKLKSLIDE